MSEKQETVADIVEEMRGLVKPGETLEHTYELLSGLADRIEAAHKREAGNGAKIREALKEIERKAIATIPGSSIQKRMLDKFRLLAGAALAEPARNCDVGTVDEQTERFVDFARLYFQSEVVRLALNWAQMPYESEMME